MTNRKATALERVYKGKPVRVFLTNGVKLRGVAVEFCDDWLLLSFEDNEQHVFYEAIATISHNYLGEKNEKV